MAGERAAGAMQCYRNQVWDRQRYRPSGLTREKAGPAQRGASARPVPPCVTGVKILWASMASCSECLLT